MTKKKLPYGNCNFADITESGYAYVDKTRYIELLENENNRYQFVLRPRRFGKSLFLSTLDSYYDLNSKDKFESLFGGLYIGQHPTQERGTYAVLRFDFSGVVAVSYEKFIASFSNKVQLSVSRFFNKYKNIFADAAENVRTVRERQLGVDALLLAYNSAEEANVPVFVIIDEYDNFANDLIAMDGVYKNEVMKKDGNGGDGIVRTFYKSLKEATASVVRRIFITGVSPMMVNDLTSGFNMATDYSLFPKYNEMFGFTRDEVEWLIDETGIDRNLIKVDMEYYYNGYMFNNKGKDKVYNSQMTLFLFNQIQQLGEQPTQVVDPNLKTNYERLRRLAGNEKNQEILLNISKDGGTAGDIVEDFSLDKLHDEDHFLSMLFYLGMLTRGGIVDDDYYLKIPNYSVKTLYWEYVVEYVNKLADGKIETSKLSAVVSEMARKGNIIPYLNFFVENYLKLFDNRDLANFDEKYIKAIMLPTLYMNTFYRPDSEKKNINGYMDIFLEKRHSAPGMVFEYAIELKYVKTRASQQVKEAKFAEALSQLEKYKQDPLFAGRDDVKFLALVFRGKSGYEIREVKSKDF